MSVATADRSSSSYRQLLELTAREKERYSISRAILAVADRKNSFEREISEEIRKGGLPSGVGHATGFYVPWDIVIDPAAVRRTESRFRAGTTLTTTTTGQGKELVLTTPERSSSTFTARWSVRSSASRC